MEFLGIEWAERAHALDPATVQQDQFNDLQRRFAVEPIDLDPEVSSRPIRSGTSRMR